MLCLPQPIENPSSIFEYLGDTRMHTPDAGKTYNKHRIEAVSDGIFTIAMTLLAFNLKPPTGFPRGHVWYPLALQWPLWLSFALTFALTARFWALQHDVLEVIERFGHRALIAVFAFLGLIAALPFSTSLLAEHFSDHSVMTFYLMHELVIATMLPLMLEFCAYSGHLREDIDLRSLRIRLYMLALSIAGALLVAATVSQLYWIALPPFLFGIFERRMQRRPLKH
jgi:uncharacterized membrane protein